MKFSGIGWAFVSPLLIITLLFAGCADEEDGVTIKSMVNDEAAPQVARTVPADGAKDVETSSDIVIHFNQTMDADTITTNTLDITCSGSIQLSSNDFASCIQMASEPEAASDNTSFTLKPASDLDEAETYKVKALNEVAGSLGISMVKEYLQTTGFETASSPATEPTEPTEPTAPGYKALDFDGAGEYLKIPSAVQSYNYGTPIAIGMWFTPSVIGSYQTVFSMSNSSAGGIDITIRNDGTIMIFISDGTLSRMITSSVSVTAGTAYCLGVVLGSMGSIYFNGVEDSGASDDYGSVTFGSNSYAFNIGTTYETNGNFFTGKIHAIAYWDNSEMMGNNFPQVYNSGDLGFDLSTDSGNYDQSAYLQHWWKLGEDEAQFGKDYGPTPYNLISGSNMDSSDIVDYP